MTFFINRRNASMYGQYRKIVIEGKNIKGKDYTLRLWEDDTTGKNDLLYERRGKFESNSQMFYVDLTEEMQ